MEFISVTSKFQTDNGTPVDLLGILASIEILIFKIKREQRKKNLSNILVKDMSDIKYNGLKI